jgi:hypothetical protein
LVWPRSIPPGENSKIAVFLQRESTSEWVVVSERLVRAGPILHGERPATDIFVQLQSAADFRTDTEKLVRPKRILLGKWAEIGIFLRSQPRDREIRIRSIR